MSSSRKGRGSKYITRSNLHIISPQKSISEQKKTLQNVVVKSSLETPDSKTKSSKQKKTQESSKEKTQPPQTINKPAVPETQINKPDSSLTELKKTGTVGKSNLGKATKSKPVYETKSYPRIEDNYYLSNFLALSLFDKSCDQNIRKSKSLSHDKQTPSKGNSCTKVPTEQISKNLPITKTKAKASVQASKSVVQDVFETKTSVSQKKLDTPLKELKVEKIMAKLEPGKKTFYHQPEPKGGKDRKLKQKLELSKHVKIPHGKESFQGKVKLSPGHSLSVKRDACVREGFKSSRESSHRDNEMLHKGKYYKYKNAKEDREREETYDRSKYTWHSKNYEKQLKSSEVRHSSKDYYNLTKKRDFYEKTALYHRESRDFKIPMCFRKCLVRYLPYTVYSYFRPKWYYLSHKRYTVNYFCASGKKCKISKKEYKLARTSLKNRENYRKNENKKLKKVKQNERIVSENVKEVYGVEVDADEAVAEVDGNEEAVAEVDDNEEVVAEVDDNEEAVAEGDDNEEAVAEGDDNEEAVAEGDDNEVIAEVMSEVDENEVETDTLLEETETQLTNLSEDTIENVFNNGDEVELMSLEENKIDFSGTIVPDNEKTITNENNTTEADSCNMDNTTPTKVSIAVSKKTLTEVDESMEEEIQIIEECSIIGPKNIVIIDLEAEDASENIEETSDNGDKDQATQNPITFQKCDTILEFSSDFYQGDVAIQSYLTFWKSHLIGLEYMLEVQNDEDEKVIERYHCGLCNKNFPFEKSIEQIVVRHVSSYEHMSNYMAKHFSSSDFNFSKSVRSYVNEIMLQTCCEEINDKLGYHYMCVVKENVFQNEYDKIQEYFSVMKHWDESSIDVYPTIIINQLESDSQVEVKCLIGDIIDKILVTEPKQTFFVPETIVSGQRRSTLKDKKKDVLNLKENTVNRSSQNTLIVLTPSPVRNSESPKKIKSPKIVAKEALYTTTTSENTQESVDAEGDKVVTVDSSSKVQDKEIPAKFTAKKVDNSRLPDKDLAPDSEGKDCVRVVRIQASHKKILIQPDSDEEVEVGLKEKPKEDINPSSEVIENAGIADVLQGEDISDDNFSDMELVEEVSPVEETQPLPRSQSRNKQHKHSRFCPKRKAWIKGSSIDKDSSLKGVSISGSAIPTIDKIIKRPAYSYKKIYDECSQDSLKRKRSPCSSSSPSLEEFLHKLSPSPDRNRFKSPLRGHSVYRKHSSMTRRHSRSPYRRHSGSPDARYSRSGPFRKRSKSPINRRSSPYKRYSKSPNRRRSRSPPYIKGPYTRRSRSPIRKRSRSPYKRRSRSPIRKRSRSPVRKRSGSPVRKRSRSPLWSGPKHRNDRTMKSPVRKIVARRISRSPDRPSTKTQFEKFPRSPPRQLRSPPRQLRSPPSKLRSPPRKLRSPDQDFPGPKSDSRVFEDSLKYKSSKHSKDSILSGSSKSTSGSIASSNLSKKESREITDLEEVSDEDESKYFNTPEVPKYMEIIKNLPESARIMLVKVLQKFSITNINPNDPSFLELMKFVASHSAEIQRLMSQSSALPEMTTPVQSTPPPQSQEAFLQQYILSGMAGNMQLPNVAVPSTSNAFPGPSGINFQQAFSPLVTGQQFLNPSYNLAQNQFAHHIFQQPIYHVHGMSTIPKVATEPIVVPQQVLAPQQMVTQQQVIVNSPATKTPQFKSEAFNIRVSPQKPIVPPRPKATPEVMFKDLKAKVNKIFGGEDILSKIGIKIPGFNDKPSNLKSSASTSSMSQIKPELQTNVHGIRSGINLKNEISSRSSDTFQKTFSKESEGYNESPRQGLHIPPPDAKVAFCDVQRTSTQRNLFPVVNKSETVRNYDQDKLQTSVADAKKSLAQRLAAVLVKVGMMDVPAHLLQEMLMKIGAFSLNPPQDINEGEILGILRKLKYI